MRRYLDFIGNIGLFALHAARRALVPPFEFQMILRQIEVAGWKSLPLVLSSGFALGLVLALHTQTTLVQFGAQAEMPAVQSLTFFNEIGPLLAGLLMAGRVGARIGAELVDTELTKSTSPKSPSVAKIEYAIAVKGDYFITLEFNAGGTPYELEIEVKPVFPKA